MPSIYLEGKDPYISQVIEEGERELRVSMVIPILRKMTFLAIRGGTRNKFWGGLQSFITYT